MLFTGRFSRSVDDKFRVAIPKPFRTALGPGEKSVLYVAPGLDGSLALYPEEAFAKVAERLASGSPTARDVRAFSRLFYAQTQATELDGQGRIRLPAESVCYAGIAGEALLIGVHDHIELWNPQRWEAYAADRQPHFDEIAESAFGQIVRPTRSPAVPDSQSPAI